ncbi:hypothetical protein E2C01_084591 [Portunus trituberculatus]|uniref:Uncharacterized protein n=1 Tax=Portunus trituberculatus TaxID=210409 RepID=A0A5B7J856_PORTR|nr:hypothetical protein [Portunus trituberculatus]
MNSSLLVTFGGSRSLPGIACNIESLLPRLPLVPFPLVCVSSPVPLPVCACKRHSPPPPPTQRLFGRTSLSPRDHSLEGDCAARGRSGKPAI